jgi:hypothetical protein
MSYILMGILTVTLLITVSVLKDKYEITKIIGALSWIGLSLYFIVEFLVIKASTASYNFLKQPMSDLGVTICGIDTYELAAYEICSPAHLAMNWTFTLTGIAVFTGAIFLHKFWPDNKKTKTATVLLVIFGLSYSISGIFPADINFLVHTFASLPGMFVQIPALIIIGRAIKSTMQKLSKWTYFCLMLNLLSLLLIFLQPVFPELPGGLIQRALYASIWLWMAVTGVVLLNKSVKRK